MHEWIRVSAGVFVFLKLHTTAKVGPYTLDVGHLFVSMNENQDSLMKSTSLEASRNPTYSASHVCVEVFQAVDILSNISSTPDVGIQSLDVSVY